MENEQTQNVAEREAIVAYAAHLLVNDKMESYYAREKLKEEKGLDDEAAFQVIEYVEEEIRKARQSRANKDMLYGALWCVGGTIATVSNIGYIFWGAIVFGAIQFFSGVAKSFD